MPSVPPLDGPAPRTVVTRDLIVGRGPLARAGLWASVDYVIGTSSGRRLDAIWGTEGMPLKVAGGMVLRGWDLGMRGMRVGGRREIIIPPALGYGSAGRPPDIKPNETLIVVVDLIAVSKRDPLMSRSSSGDPGG
jgi:FKBP-type peptidyl-prolyl cis-trans isomerase